MALRLRRLRAISRIFPQFYSGTHYRRSRKDVNLLSLNPLPQLLGNIDRKFEGRGGYVLQGFSTVSERSHESFSEVDLLPFIESNFDELEGPYHRWLNRAEVSKDFHASDGVFLVLGGAFLEDSSISGCDPVVIFEKVKSLQQRYPTLNVMGFLYGSSICSDASCTRLLQTTMKEYITFPFLLCNKKYDEMTDGACYILSKGFKSPLIYHEGDVDIETIDEAIKELNVQRGENPRLVSNLKSSWIKQAEAIKEPHVCSSLQNMLLYFPGCISVDESGDRLFLSDTNHHRIIIFDGNGKIVDSIGSSPGFEDGNFESAKLMRPAASFYHAAEDCLYFVESENHSIRRADMERRVLETLYPAYNISEKNDSIWSWIMDKLWMKRDVDTNSEEINSDSLLFPWHLMKLEDDNLFILNRSFETLWIMDLALGAIKEVIKGFPKILELCGEMIHEKTSYLKHMPCDLLQQQADTDRSFEGIPYAGLMSSLAVFQDQIIICDTVGQRLLKVSKDSGLISSFHLSNFGILGLPYWVSSSFERAYAFGGASLGVHTDHVQSFSLLPGRVDIELNIDIPKDTELVEPLQDGCVWRQARGAATEVSGAESKAASTEKVGVSQLWYDELDNLAFTTPEVEVTAEEENLLSDGNLQKGRVCIDCVVNTSPGTSEVIIYAALYLRLRRESNSQELTPEKKAARIADIMNPKRSGKMGSDPCIHFLLKSNRDLGEVIFMKPLHVRLKIDCGDHPKADNSKDIILTDSSIDVDVSLN